MRVHICDLQNITQEPCCAPADPADPYLVPWNSSARAREGAAQKRPQDVTATALPTGGYTGDLMWV